MAVDTSPIPNIAITEAAITEADKECDNGMIDCNKSIAVVIYVKHQLQLTPHLLLNLVLQKLTKNMTMVCMTMIINVL